MTLPVSIVNEGAVIGQKPLPVYIAGGGTASGSNSGLMSAADKAKLDQLTVPASGTVALLNQANTFTQNQTVNAEVRLGDEKAVRIESLDTSRWSMKATSSIFNSVRDNLLRLGWNVDQEDATEPQWLIQFESNYKDVPADSNVSEFHVAYTSAAGVGRRPIQINVYRQGASANNCQVWLTGETKFYPSATGSTASFVIQETGELIANTNSSAFVHLTNNQNILKQRNAANSAYVPLIRLNTSDEVLLAPDGGITTTGGNLRVPFLHARSDAVNAKIQIEHTVNGDGYASQIEFKGGGSTRAYLGTSRISGAYYFEVTSAGGTKWLSLDSNGQVGVNTDTAMAAQLHVAIATGSRKGLLIKGTSSQTAPLIECQDNAAVVQAQVDTGASATATGLLLLHNGTLKRVEVGATDSGGSGFRALRVVN